MKLLLTPVPVGYGTTMRCLAIAVACRTRGHEVLFACSDELSEQITKHGFSLRPIRDSRVDPNSRRPPARQYMNQHSPRLLENQLADLLTACHEFQPDVVVSSHNMMALVAGAAYGVPSVSVFHPGILELESFPMLFTLLAEQLRVGVVTARARARCPVPPAPHGDLSCIPSIPELISWPWLLPPGVLTRKEDAIPVGALLMRDPDALPERGQLRRELQVREEGPFVFATVGGAVANERYVRALVEGLRAADVASICSVGNRLPDSAIDELDRPPVRVVRFLPDDLDALGAADALLWHGGHETMLKAVACGVPAVGVPVQFDQNSNVRALERSGAGLRIVGSDLRPDRVAAAIRRVLDEPGFRLAAERLAASNRRAGGAPHLVELIELFVTPRGRQQQAA